MLRKALILGMVFIFALSLFAVSMITCFTYDADAHPSVCIKKKIWHNGQWWWAELCKPPRHHDTGD